MIRTLGRIQISGMDIPCMCGTKYRKKCHNGACRQSTKYGLRPTFGRVKVPRCPGALGMLSRTRGLRPIEPKTGAGAGKYRQI